MTTIESEILRTLDEALFLPFTNSPIKKPVESASNSIFITVQNPALPIESSDFENSWSPGKRNANQFATKHFSDWVNAIPALDPNHHSNGQTVSECYQSILEASISGDTEDNVSRSYKEAELILYKTISIIDPLTGQSSSQTVDSDLYCQYKENKAKYLNALAVYQAQYIIHRKTPQGKGMWPLLNAGFYAPVEVAWNQYRSGEATKVEDALSTIDRMNNNLVHTAFQDAIQHYTAYQKVDPEDPSRSFSPSYPMPSNWMDETEGWTEMSFSVKKSTSRSQTISQNEQILDIESKNLDIKFQFKVVRIERPWMRLSLISLPNWSINKLVPGSYSNGTKVKQEQSLFPLLAQAFIVVQNLTIGAKWSDLDITQIESAITSKDSKSFARFLLNGLYLSKHEDIRYRATFNDNVLTFPGIHVVGWINRILPFSPPKIDTTKFHVT
jgi:hypothetical protein